MPAAGRPSKSAITRLKRLPRRADMVIEGGKRPTGLSVQEEEHIIQPELALWLIANRGTVLGFRLIMPGGAAGPAADHSTREAVSALVEALAAPLPAAGLDEPALPGKIVVNDAALAHALREVFTPLEVAVEEVEELPLFDHVWEELQSTLEGGRAEPFTWDVDPAPLPALYAAAARYARLAPWEYMPDNPPLAIALGELGPEAGVETLYAAILGGGGEVFGSALYYSLDDYLDTLERGAEIEDSITDEDVTQAIDLLRRVGAPVDELPPEEVREMVTGFITAEELEAEEDSGLEADSLAVFFDPADETDSTYLDWLRAHHIKVPRRNVPYFTRISPEAQPRPPTNREVRAFTLSLQALDDFFTRYSQALSGPFLPLQPLVAGIHDDASGAEIQVTFPPADYAMLIAGLADDDEEVEEEE